MVITLKNVLRNQKADDLETWYAALRCSSTTKFVQMMTLEILTYFTARLNLVPYAFV